MFKEIRWLFFDVGLTIMNEQIAYGYRMRDMADLANMSFEKVYEMAKNTNFIIELIQNKNWFAKEMENRK